MRNPVTRYLIGIFARYYIAVLLLAMALTLPFALRAYASALIVLPFAFVSIASISATLVHLDTWGELEILASLGVSFRRIATPLWIAALAPPMALSAMVVAASRASPGSSLVVVCTLLGTVLAIGSAFAIARRRVLPPD